MPSTYTTSLKIQEIANGEQSGYWGTTTNTNWTLIEQAVAGVETITMTNANYTLTNLNGTIDEARNAVLIVAGTNSAIYQVIAPLVPKVYIIKNSTIGGYAITIGGVTGAVVNIPNGATAQVFCDGVGFYASGTSAVGSFSISGNLTVGGSTNVNAITATSYTGPGTGLTGTAGALSIGGNAATANLATAATTATTANSSAALNTTSFSIIESGGVLQFKYGSTVLATLDSSGNFNTIANVTAYYGS